MDTSKYIKPCPRCGSPIEPKRTATLGDKIMGGITGLGGAFIGFAVGGPAGTVAGAVAGYEVGKHGMMSIEDDHDQNQWFKYKCSNCGCNWKEKIHTNDHPDDITPLVNSMGW